MSDDMETIVALIDPALDRLFDAHPEIYAADMQAAVYLFSLRIVNKAHALWGVSPVAKPAMMLDRYSADGGPPLMTKDD